jgi:hypothetical protein
MEIIVQIGLVFLCIGIGVVVGALIVSMTAAAKVTDLQVENEFLRDELHRLRMLKGPTQ